MLLRKKLGAVLVVLTGILAMAAPALGDAEHVYSVSLTIEVDRAAHKINGTIVTEAPSEFCESSSVRIMEIEPGKDRKVAAIFPYGGQYHMTSRPPLRGKRVYAEVLPYHLPERPVECLAARSRTVTAP